MRHGEGSWGMTGSWDYKLGIAKCKLQIAGGNRPGVYGEGWTSLVHFSQGEKRFFGIVEAVRNRS